MMHRVHCTIQDGYQITAQDEEGHEVLMDIKESAGGEGKGFLPMPLLLASLGGCLSVDVKLILERMRRKVDSISLQLEGVLDDSTPRVYQKIQLAFHVKSSASQEEMEKALALAEEKYCNVSAMLKQVVPIESHILKED